MALTADGNLYAWGQNNYGQLGINSTENKSTPTKVDFTFDGDIKQIALGQNHSAVLTSTNSLYMWGYNAQGQLGINSTTNQLQPTKVDFTFDGNIKQIALGNAHSAILTSTNSLYSWGYNGYGQLGINSTTNQLQPTKVNFNFDGDIKQVALGGSHSAVLTSTNSLYTWGYNSTGQLGINSTTNQKQPTKVNFAFDGDIKQIALGAAHSAVLTSNNSMYTWGYNYLGQLGINSTTNRLQPTKVNFTFDGDIKQIALGDNHSTILTSNNSLYTCGYNDNGQLGINSTTEKQLQPTKVDFAFDGDIKQIALGGYHSTLITSTNSLYTWGYNAHGQLGNGTTTKALTPQLISLPTED